MASVKQWHRVVLRRLLLLSRVVAFDEDGGCVGCARLGLHGAPLVPQRLQFFRFLGLSAGEVLGLTDVRREIVELGLPAAARGDD